MGVGAELVGQEVLEHVSGHKLGFGQFVEACQAFVFPGLDESRKAQRETSGREAVVLRHQVACQGVAGTSGD